MAGAVPILLDHDIAVYRFQGPASIDAEVYYATDVRTESYFQGHYLKAVDVEKQAETLDVSEGWFWVPTAQSMGNLITYLMEPETDDNLITWGWTDHILEETSEEDDEDDELQRVPMMRVLTHQNLPVLRVGHFNDFQRNRFYR